MFCCRLQLVGVAPPRGDGWAEPATTPHALRERWQMLHKAHDVVGFYGCGKTDPHWYLLCPALMLVLYI